MLNINVLAEAREILGRLRSFSKTRVQGSRVVEDSFQLHKNTTREVGYFDPALSLPQCKEHHFQRHRPPASIELFNQDNACVALVKYEAGFKLKETL